MRVLWAELESVVLHELVPFLGSEGGRGYLHGNLPCLVSCLGGSLVFFSLLLLEYLEEATSSLLISAPLSAGVGALSERDDGRGCGDAVEVN